MPSTYINKSLLPIVIAILALLLFIGGTSSTFANGSHPGAREVFSGNSGPHFISATTTPVVGQLHWIIFVTQPDGTEPVRGVTLDMTGNLSGSDHSSLKNVNGEPSKEGPQYYTVDIPVNTAGNWIFTLNVRSQLGSSTIEIPVTIVRSSGINFGIIGLAGAVIILIALIALSANRRRKQKSDLIENC